MDPNTLLFLTLLILLAMVRTDLFKQIVEGLFKTIDTFLIKIVDEYLEKLSSGRYFIVIVSTLTVGLVTWGSLDLLAKKIIDDKTFLTIFLVSSNITTGATAYYFGQANKASRDQVNASNEDVDTK